MRTILSGTVGSTAFNMARPGSDIDTLSVYLEPTLDVLGLDTIRLVGQDATVTTKAPDVCSHELLKFVTLCLGGDPTTNTLLWLQRDVVGTVAGRRLMAAREDFLSARLVDRHVGFITGQIKSMLHADGTETERKPKAARHTVRLLVHLRGLVRSGILMPHLTPSQVDMVFAMSEEPADRLVRWLETEIEGILLSPRHPLVARPEPKRMVINDIVRRIRVDDLINLV